MPSVDLDVEVRRAHDILSMAFLILVMVANTLSVASVIIVTSAESFLKGLQITSVGLWATDILDGSSWGWLLAILGCNSGPWWYVGADFPDV